MSEEKRIVDVKRWVENAVADPVKYQQRQAGEIVLNALPLIFPERHQIFLKGGTLMGLAYGSPRETSDIDLTACIAPDIELVTKIKSALDDAYPKVAARLGYVGIVVRTLKAEPLPNEQMATNKAPGIKIKVGYAIRGSAQERALARGAGHNAIEVDISFNEPVLGSQILELTGGAEIEAYSLTDLIAEKLRALLQQAVRRKKGRRQDVFDIAFLKDHHQLSDHQLTSIHQALVEKCRARDISPDIGSIDHDEIRRKAEAEWATMEIEVGELPEFEPSFEAVRQLYRSLPW